MRKDIKKSSYYVWFLGSQEARGLRGGEYVGPVVRALVDREREVEPYKVTLEVSHKGMKIVQNVQGAAKQFVPHHAVTYVHQQEDLVACILLLYNPNTRCPVHVHVYRCDSVDTANLLHGQLRVLTERPDNQRKLQELETRLTAKGLLPGPTARRRVPPPGSDGRSSSTRESESSGGSYSERLSGGHQERIANLYDSLAAELKEKLGTGGQQPQAPILLPPRDYDTVHRQKGNLTEINARRCLNMNIVGVSGVVEGARLQGGVSSPSPSGGSSGIGSDHAPSPDHDHSHSFLDNESTSDEEWNSNTKDASLFVMPPGPGQGSWRGSGGGGGGELSLPRARRLNSAHSDSPNSPVSFQNSSYVEPDIQYFQNRSKNHDSDQKQIEEPAIHPDLVKIKKHHSINSSSSHPESHPVIQRRPKNAEQRQRSPSPTNAKSTVGSLTPRDRFNDAKEKFLSLEREKQEERERQERALLSEHRKNIQALEPAVMPVVRSKGTSGWSRSRDSEDDMEEIPQNRHPPNDDGYRYQNEREYHPALRREPSYLKNQSHGSIPDTEDYTPRHVGKPSSRYAQRRIKPSPVDSHAYSIEDNRFPPIHRRYSSPGRDQSPDMKMVNESPSPITRKYPEQHSVDEMNAKYRRKIPRSHLNMNPIPPFAENNSSIPLERYRSPTRVSRSPAPRNSDEEANPNYRHMMHQDSRNYPGRISYDDKKRRSMYESIEDERRRNSNELAKEFKRRSFQDPRNMGYQELDEHERYPGLDRETARMNVGEMSPTRYRHSYAEPENMQPHHEPVQCNTPLSSGRVGMAAIHPY